MFRSEKRSGTYVSDPIGDLLVRLRNAAAAGQTQVIVPHSKMKAAILAILKREGVIEDIAERQQKGRKVIEVTLAAGRKGAFPEITRVSRPGRRVYTRSKEIPRPLRGLGLVVLSTTQGIMTGREARRRGLGGEVLFQEK